MDKKKKPQEKRQLLEIQHKKLIENLTLTYPPFFFLFTAGEVLFADVLMLPNGMSKVGNDAIRDVAFT